MDSVCLKAHAQGLAGDGALLAEAFPQRKQTETQPIKTTSARPIYTPHRAGQGHGDGGPEAIADRIS